MAPTVSTWAIASITARSPTLTGSSSRKTAPLRVDVDRFHSAHGINCFLPMSATTSHHGPVLGDDSHERIMGFSPLLALA